MKNFVKSRAELTAKMNEYKQRGFNCYRVREACSCCQTIKNPEQNYKSNQRNAVLIVKNNTIVATIIRCRLCAKIVEQKSKHKTNS